MFDHYITFRSLTSAQLGVAACRNHGLMVMLARLPQTVSNQGCNYSIKASNDTIDQVLLVLRLENIFYEHVFRKEGNRMEEVFY